MPFYIADRTYTKGTDRKPEAFGFIEGYTSNTVGKTYLRMNIKEELDQEKYDWYIRLYGEVPHDVHDYDHKTMKCFLRNREVGDAVGEGIRLDRKQVVRAYLGATQMALAWLVRRTPMYIEREAFVKYIRSREGNFIDDMGKGWSNGMDAAASICEKFPAADVVEVVRCKECRFWSNEANGLSDERVCRRISVKGLVSNYTLPEGFCSCGERKETNDL